ncbi:MAG: ribosome maturation factor RimM [Lachnospiraceae bacterium]|nr:ribosome maturation factor RimM [Lachnospiraceae bacterium]
MSLDDMLRVGVYANTHGIRGEIKLWPTTDDPGRFHKGLKLYLDTGREPMELTVESVKNFKNMVILGFAGIHSINDIERYKGSDIYVSREDALPLEEGEYYICDLVGCAVVEENGTPVGTLTDVMTTGANDVYIVTTPQKREILLPVIPDCIKKVDIPNKVVTVYLMPGLV